MAPGSTLKVMKDGKVEREFRLQVPPRIYGFKERCQPLFPSL